MKENMIPFVYGDYGVRVVKDDSGEPWFVAKDVCKILEHSDPSMATSRLEDDEKGTRKVCTPGGEQEMLTVNESGLYALIIRSNKPEAKKFRKWITAEVLPSIRKTGQYRADGPDKRVDVGYFRGTTAPKGLDIRYTLDLTKICMNPTRGSLQLLSRLTGIDMDDLEGEVAVGGFGNVNQAIARFCAELLEEKPGHWEKTEILYRAFIEFCWDQKEEIVSASVFGRDLGRMFPGAVKKRESTGARSWGYRGIGFKGV